MKTSVVMQNMQNTIVSGQDALDSISPMQVVGDKLHEKQLPDVIDNVKNGWKNDQPNMISIISDPKPVRFRLFKGQRKLFAAMSRQEQLTFNRLTRICILHGYAIHMKLVGDRLEKLHLSIQPDLYGKNEGILNRLTSVNCSMDLRSFAVGNDNNSTVTMGEEEKGMIGIAASDACMPVWSFILYLILLSLCTHPELENWKGEWQEDINLVIARQEERLSKFPVYKEKDGS